MESIEDLGWLLLDGHLARLLTSLRNAFVLGRVSMRLPQLVALATWRSNGAATRVEYSPGVALDRRAAELASSPPTVRRARWGDVLLGGLPAPVRRPVDPVPLETVDQLRLLLASIGAVDPPSATAVLDADLFFAAECYASSSSATFWTGNDAVQERREASALILELVARDG